MKVSIIIPVYNAHKFLKKTLENIDEEISHEIIIVDDGSNDTKTKELLKSLEKDKGLKIFYKENGGSASARNFGASKALGEYLLFLDSDDLIQKNFASIMAKELDNDKNISFCFPNEVLFGSRLGFWQVMSYDAKLLKYYQYFMVTSLVRKSVFDKLNGFDENFKYLEDREFWVRASINGYVGKKVEVLHFYRHHHLSKTSAVNKTKIMNEYERKIHQKFAEHYHPSDYLNKKVLFYSAYIKLFYLIPTALKDYMLMRGIKTIKNRPEILNLFPREVKESYQGLLF